MPDRAKTARVLLAGGAGFIGSTLVRSLLRSGVSVAVLDNFEHGRPENLHSVVDQLSFVAHADASRWDQTIEVFSRFAPTHVVSCIGDPMVQAAYEQMEKFVANNIISTLNILRASSRLDVQHVVYLSSTEVYGNRPGSLLNESAELDPVNSYAVTKLAADRLCHTYAIEHGLRVTVARIFNTYGPRETHAYIIPEVIDQLSRGTELRLGNIDTARDFTFVEDTARAIAQLLFSDRLGRTVYNVGSGTPIRIAALIDLIAEEMGRSAVSTVFDPTRARRRDIDSFACDYGALAKDTGWKPLVPLRNGLRRTISWFRNHDCKWPWKTLEEELALAKPTDTGAFRTGLKTVRLG